MGPVPARPARVRGLPRASQEADRLPAFASWFRPALAALEFRAGLGAGLSGRPARAAARPRPAPVVAGAGLTLAARACVLLEPLSRAVEWRRAGVPAGFQARRADGTRFRSRPARRGLA